MSPSAIASISSTASLTSINSYVHNTKDTYIEHDGVSDSKKLIEDALKERVKNIDHENCEPGDEDTFFVADLGEVYRQHMRWKLNLPRVKPFYGKQSLRQLPFSHH
jgi:ornithine decarboxylase